MLLHKSFTIRTNYFKVINITRTTERGTVIIPSEAISREQALKVYTINNAYASFEENLKGSIEPGKLADRAVLSKDFLTCNVDQIKDIQSELTIFWGKIIYSPGRIIMNQKEHHAPFTNSDK